MKVQKSQNNWSVMKNRNLWRIKLMNNKRIIIGVTIGITAAILWSVVFINVLNSMAGIGIGVCLGISFGISGSLIFSKKDKWWYNFQFSCLRQPFNRLPYSLFGRFSYPERAFAKLPVKSVSRKASLQQRLRNLWINRLRRSAGLLPQLIGLKILKYTKHSCNFQTSIWKQNPSLTTLAIESEVP